MSIVRYRKGELPPITEEREWELRGLAARPDSEIDYSDIPPLDDGFRARSIPNPLFSPALCEGGFFPLRDAGKRLQ